MTTDFQKHIRLFQWMDTHTRAVRCLRVSKNERKPDETKNEAKVLNFRGKFNNIGSRIESTLRIIIVLQ